MANEAQDAQSFTDFLPHMKWGEVAETAGLSRSVLDWRTGGLADRQTSRLDDP